MPPYFSRTVSSRGPAFATASTSTWTGFFLVFLLTISKASRTMRMASSFLPVFFSVCISLLIRRSTISMLLLLNC